MYKKACIISVLYLIVLVIVTCIFTPMNETYAIFREGQDIVLAKTLVFQKINSETEEMLFDSNLVKVNGRNSNYHKIVINKTILNIELFLITSAYLVFLTLIVIQKKSTAEIKN